MQLNNALALASFCAKETSVRSSWNPTFTVRGTPYMCIGTLFPHMNEIPKFAQIYVHDPKDGEDISHIRMNHMMLPRNLNDSHKSIILDLLSSLEYNLKVCNPYVRQFLAAKDLPDAEIGQNHELEFHDHLIPNGEHERRYNELVTPYVC